jgi:hypothetical protein
MDNKIGLKPKSCVEKNHRQKKGKMVLTKHDNICPIKHEENFSTGQHVDLTGRGRRNFKSNDSVKKV